mmetsp:Transcript_12561/g.35949  ORF Transcript_12561/g.35949 Transcript_12561/m.35949 type:complete len:207 (-) Transcript_12561:948-1568(-)
MWLSCNTRSQSLVCSSCCSLSLRPQTTQMVASTPALRNLAYSPSTMSDSSPTPSPPPMTRTIFRVGSSPSLALMSSRYSCPCSVVRSPNRSAWTAKSCRMGNPDITSLSSLILPRRLANVANRSDATKIFSTLRWNHVVWALPKSVTTVKNGMCRPSRLLIFRVAMSGTLFMVGWTLTTTSGLYSRMRRRMRRSHVNHEWKSYATS